MVNKSNKISVLKEINLFSQKGIICGTRLTENALNEYPGCAGLNRGAALPCIERMRAVCEAALRRIPKLGGFSIRELSEKICELIEAARCTPLQAVYDLDALQGESGLYSAVIPSGTVSVNLSFRRPRFDQTARKGHTTYSCGHHEYRCERMNTASRETTASRGNNSRMIRYRDMSCPFF